MAELTEHERIRFSDSQPKLRTHFQFFRIAIFAGLAFILLFFWNFAHVDSFNQPTDCVIVEFLGLQPEEMSQVKCNWAVVPDNPVNKNSYIFPRSGARLIEGTTTWKMPAYYNGVLQVQATKLARQKITEILITADEVHLSCKTPDVWKDFVEANHKNIGEALDKESWATYSRYIPHHPPDINDHWLIKLTIAGLSHFQWSALSIALLIPLFLVMNRQKSFHRIFEFLLVSPLKKNHGEAGYFLIGLFITIAALAFAESRDSFYFLQDDNFDQFLPVMEKGVNALISTGKLSTWNPFQFMGSPTTSLGIYALTYPPTYIAYWLADRVLGNSHLTIEVFTFAHLVAGYVVTYSLLRELNVRSSVSTIGALSFVLSGFFLIGGRSWYYVTPVAFWAPLMVLLINRLLKKPVNYRWTAAMGLTIGLFFHAGNAQMWFYTISTCAVGITVALLTGALPVRRLLTAAPALLIGIGIAAPLIFVQTYEAAEAFRSPLPGTFAGISWINLFVPAGNLLTNQSASYPVRVNGELYYSGGIFCFLTLAGIWYLTMRLVFTQKTSGVIKAFLKKNIWLLPAVLSLALVAGYDGFLWNLTACLPVFSKFTQAGKFLVYVDLFSLITSAVIIERFLAMRSVNRIAEISSVAFMTLLLSAHVFLCQSAFYHFTDKPYPALNAEIHSLTDTASKNNTPQRILSCSPQRDQHAGFPESLALNFPTQYKLFGLEGYEPLISQTPTWQAVTNNIDKNPLTSIRNYGVKFVVLYHNRPNKNLSTLNDSASLTDELMSPKYENWMNSILPQAKLLSKLPNGAIYEIQDPAPLAFSQNQSTQALPLTVNDNGLAIDVSKVAQPTKIVVNFQYRPMFEANIDGHPVACEHDSLNRILVPLTQSGSSLNLEYNPPWAKGLVIGLILILTGLISCFFKFDRLYKAHRI